MLQDGVLVTGHPFDRVSYGPVGARTVEPEACYPGYTLFVAGMGNLVTLVDLSGLLVHFWPVQRTHLAKLLPDGDLLVDHHGAEPGLDRLAPDGSGIWSWRGPYHHDFELLSDGGILLLTRQYERAPAGLFVSREAPWGVWNDTIRWFDQSGREVWSFSLADHREELLDLAGLPLPLRFARQHIDGSVEHISRSDWAHTNAVQRLPDTRLGQMDDRFRGGNILFSCRSLDTIGIVDPRLNKIVWAWGPGVLDGQHQPTMLPTGTILVFDNGSVRGHSVVREIEPLNGESVWEYEDTGHFFSPYRSGAQRLPNGNTLICEGDAGRLFEVDRQGKITWDYYSPFWGCNVENEGRHIYRATRYSAAEVEGLFDRKGPCSGAVSPRRDSGRHLTPFRDVLVHYQVGFLGAPVR